MRAIRCAGGSARVSDEPAPRGEGVRVQVASAGICGSDLHLLSLDMPTILGHEIAGVLDDGTLVAVEPTAPCHQCGPCRNGEYNLCTIGPDMIMGIGRDGGMADECLVPASSIVPSDRVSRATTRAWWNRWLWPCTVSAGHRSPQPNGSPWSEVDRSASRRRGRPGDRSLGGHGGPT